MKDTIRLIYKIGPAPLTLVMIVGLYAYPAHDHPRTWPALLILIGGILVAMWHLLLVTNSDGKKWLVQIVYALINVPIYLFYGIFGAMMITHDAL